MALGRKWAFSGTHIFKNLRERPQAELQGKPRLQVGWRSSGWSDTSSLGQLSQ